MINPFLAEMLMSGLTPPVSDGVRLERMQKRRNDLKGILVDSLLDTMIEMENDPERKDGIRIMQAMKKASDSLDDLKYFADPDKGKVRAKDRADALTLLDCVQKHLTDFWETHTKPEGTMWD